VKRQSHQVTSKLQQVPTLNNDCEVQVIKSSLEMLSKSKNKWSNLDFNDHDGMIEFLKFMKNEADFFTRNNKNYIKIKQGDRNPYISLETDFYKSFFNFLSESSQGFTWKRVKDFFNAWR
jgi:hypothetical protein